jgi:hypothetical protein
MSQYGYGGEMRVGQELTLDVHLRHGTHAPILPTVCSRDGEGSGVGIEVGEGTGSSGREY